MTYKQELEYIATDIVKSKGYYVYKMWSSDKKNIDELVNSLNNKIDKNPGQTKVETTVKPLFVQQRFEF